MAAMIGRRYVLASRPWRLWEPSSQQEYLCRMGVHTNIFKPLRYVYRVPSSEHLLAPLDSIAREEKREAKKEVYVNITGMDQCMQEISRSITVFGRTRSESLTGLHGEIFHNSHFAQGRWIPSMDIGGVRNHMGHSHNGHESGLDQLGAKSKESKSERDKEGGEAGENIVRIGLFSDILLTISKGAAGWFSGSTAIIADAAHSVSDIVLSGVSLWSVRAARAPSNKTFPYGHGKIETAGALGVAVLLMGTGGGIAWHAAEVLQTLLPEVSEKAGEVASMLGLEVGSGDRHAHHHDGHGHSHGLDMDHVGVALAAAALSIGVKESLYWAMKAVGDKYGSQLLKANAWHHRSDAISSFVALVGIGGAMVGIPLLDPTAAIFVASMILRAGGSIASQSLKELLDIGVPDSVLDPIHRTVLEIPGVEGCLYLRGRKMGSSLHVDVHIAVDPLLSVSGGHNVGEAVRRKLHSSFPRVTEIMVHIDPADGRLTHTPQFVVEEHVHTHTHTHEQSPQSSLPSFSHNHDSEENNQNSKAFHHRYSDSLPEQIKQHDSNHRSREEEERVGGEGEGDGEVCGGEAGVLQQRDVEEKVREAVGSHFQDVAVQAVTCHFLQQGVVVELKLAMDPELKIRQAMEKAREVRAWLKLKLERVAEIDVQLELSSSEKSL